jgi:hypothetical protein
MMSNNPSTNCETANITGVTWTASDPGTPVFWLVNPQNQRIANITSESIAKLIAGSSYTLLFTVSISMGGVSNVTY